MMTPLTIALDALTARLESRAETAEVDGTSLLAVSASHSGRLLSEREEGAPVQAGTSASAERPLRLNRPLLRSESSLVGPVVVRRVGRKVRVTL